MNTREKKLEDALRVALDALQKYSKHRFNLNTGAYFSTYSDGGNEAEDAIGRILKILRSDSHDGTGGLVG